MLISITTLQLFQKEILSKTLNTELNDFLLLQRSKFKINSREKNKNLFRFHCVKSNSKIPINLLKTFILKPITSPLQITTILSSKYHYKNLINGQIYVRHNTDIFIIANTPFPPNLMTASENNLVIYLPYKVILEICPFFRNCN